MSACLVYIAHRSQALVAITPGSRHQPDDFALAPFVLAELGCRIGETTAGSASLCSSKRFHFLPQRAPNLDHAVSFGWTQNRQLRRAHSIPAFSSVQCKTPRTVHPCAGSLAPPVEDGCGITVLLGKDMQRPKSRFTCWRWPLAGAACLFCRIRDLAVFCSRNIAPQQARRLLLPSTSLSWKEGRFR